jgi:hypothetical protein
MARPRKEIDWEVVRKLCAMQCTGEEIASFSDIDYDTLQRAVKREFNMSFADYFKKHSANGKISLRRKQYEVATSGNVPMLIWLGKQYLDQKDKQSNEHTGPNGGAIDLSLKVVFENEGETSTE